MTMTKQEDKVTEFTITKESVSELRGDGNTVKVVKKQRRRFIRKPKEAMVDGVLGDGEDATDVAAVEIEEISVDAVKAAEHVEEAVDLAASSAEAARGAQEPILEQDLLAQVALEAFEVVPEIVPAIEPAAEDKTAHAKKDKKSVLKSEVEETEGSVEDAKAKRGNRSVKKAKPARGKADYLAVLDAPDEEVQDAKTRYQKRHKPRIAPAKVKHAFSVPTKPMIHEVSIPENITVADLAQKMSVKATEVIKKLMSMNVMSTINQVIEQDVASLVVEAMGHIPVAVKSDALEDEIKVINSEASMIQRAPIVTIMGHVDHGKTSLLDAIRRTKVAAGEAGGITQHIGAYHVETPRGMITFLDTPGHAAFSAMRARGAKCTDVVVLVVAADDGVMPQTIEAIQHAKAAKVPVIVAVNKMDKEDADPDRVKSELSQHDVIAEDWGGDTQFVPVSAKTGQGLDELLEAILVQSEILELSAMGSGLASGVIVESRLDKGRGAVATVLVQNGVLQQGDILLSGAQFGRIRGMIDENGHSVKEAGPSIPVEVLGLSSPAIAGDEFVVVTTERKAREVALFRQSKYRQHQVEKQQSSRLEGFLDRMQTQAIPQLNIVLKTDVQGSVEALETILQNLTTEDVKVNVVGRGVGGINESDVNLAIASKAILIGFNVRADAVARKLLESEGIKVHYFSVIYDAVDTVKSAIFGITGPKYKEVIVGLAQVRDVFRSSKFGAIAGCMVIEGLMRRDLPIRVLRDNIVIYKGELESLRRFKDDVKEVRHGIECGIGVKDYNDIKAGDQVECFEMVVEEVDRT